MPTTGIRTTGCVYTRRKTGLQGEARPSSVLHAGVSCAREYFCRWYKFAGCAKRCARSVRPLGLGDRGSPPRLLSDLKRSRTPSHWPLARAASRCSAWRPRVGEGSWVADTPQWFSAGSDTSAAGSTSNNITLFPSSADQIVQNDERDESLVRCVKVGQVRRRFREKLSPVD